MTLEEKFWQMFMIPGDLSIGKEKLKNGIFGLQTSAKAKSAGQSSQMMDYSGGGSAKLTAEKINELQKFFLEETRLGIPIIPFDEALHGLVREGAVAFPQAIGLAATWDTTLVSKVFSAIADETRSRGIHMVLSPVMNLARDARWGRVEETYGEDPFLTSRMAVTFVRNFEQKGIITTPKHFVANYADGGRDSYPVNVSERELYESYFPAYYASFTEGGGRSVMTSYNALNGRPCTANSWLLNETLKGKWGFKGFVISDASAVGGLLDLHHIVNNREESAQAAINNGLDVIFQTEYDHHIPLIKAFKNGLIKEEVIDAAVRRILRVKFELGLFEDPYVDPEEAERVNGSPEHFKLAEKAARESLVLLKNNRNTLPLKTNISSIAVLGEDALEVRLGGYSGPGIRKISILEGIKNTVQSDVIISYEKGCSREVYEFSGIDTRFLKHGNSDSFLEGLEADYYSGIDFQGRPVMSRIDKVVDFHWTLFAPEPTLKPDWYSVQWRGTLISPKTGNFKIGLEGNDGFRLYLNDELLIDPWAKQSYGTYMAPFYFEKGNSYKIRIDFYESSANGRIKLLWNQFPNKGIDEITKAVKLASQSDVAIIVAGIHEGEFQDRASLDLPGNQETLIERVAATGKPVVLVLIGGSAITMDKWLDKVDAVLMAWYPGEQGGNAVADAVFGNYNPGGKLPVTFPKSVAQLPLFYNHKPTGRGDDYYDLSGEPLFPFGFGLSYTNFKYTALKISPDEGKGNRNAKISFSLKNTGSLPGDEVVQLYIRDEVASIVRPVKELKGFVRIHLEPGDSAEISFDITPDMLEMLDDNLKRVVEPGIFKLMIGSSSRDIRLSGELNVH
ncbi:MAG: glycoside hydrolase family 3 C-terminal domain-containing protein [Bacteroidales bacterium]|nr:glycoside hydrolase family 3 C-terminal domain-containing protein [Bacteroidales bacterium]